MGQKINKEKYAIMFSKNATETTQGEVKEVLELNSEAKSERYLGVLGAASSC